MGDHSLLPPPRYRHTSNLYFLFLHCGTHILRVSLSTDADMLLLEKVLRRLGNKVRLEGG